MPVPLTVSCFIKIQIGFTFLVPALPGSPGKRAVKRVLLLLLLLLLEVIEWVYADELAVLAETEEDLIKRLNEWKDKVGSKGTRVNMNKTKVMISGERQMVRQRQKTVRWP